MRKQNAYSAGKRASDEVTISRPSEARFLNFSCKEFDRNLCNPELFSIFLTQSLLIRIA